MNYRTNVYSHSGSISPMTIIMTALGFGGAAILSLIYAYILVYTPIAGYISIIFVAGFAFSLAFMISMIGYIGKCRNLLYMKVLGVVLGSFGIYASWVFFIYALYNKSGSNFDLVGFFLSPGSVWSAISMINETGWYSIKSTTPSGAVLWIFWGIEAAAILFFSYTMSSGSIETEMFCERCGEWCDKTEKVHLELPEDESLLESFKNGDSEKLSQMESVSDLYYPRIDVLLFNCKSCKDTSGYKLQLATVEINDDGKASENIDDLSEIFTLQGKDFEALKELGNRPVKEIEPEPEPEESETDPVDTETEEKKD